MKINESKLDSVTRIIGAVILLCLGSDSALSGTPAIIVFILSVVLLLTGAVGFCPLYALFKSRRK